MARWPEPFAFIMRLLRLQRVVTMHQVKLFKGLETDLPGLEKQMNDWLAASGAHVVNMFGNLAPQKDETQPDASGVAHSLYLPANIFLAVLYEKSEKAKS